MYAKIPFTGKVLEEDNEDGGKNYYICDLKGKTWFFPMNKTNAKQMQQQLENAEIEHVNKKDLPKNIPPQGHVVLIMYPGGVVFRHPCLRF